MGRYLEIGIVTSMAVSKTEAEKRFGDIDTLKSKMTKFVGDPSLFKIKESDNVIIFTLDEKTAYENIGSFVKEFYELCIDKREMPYAKEAEKEISDYSDWKSMMELAKDKSCYNFQISEDYGYLYYGSFYNDYIRVYIDSIMLVMQGKIELEVEGGLFKVFEKLLREKLAPNPLSKALRVFISS